MPERRGHRKMELLSPAGSPEAVVAAVQNGADAIYLGFGDYNLRSSARNFTENEFGTALRYCRVRGCKAYLTLNTLCGDKEITEATRLARLASDLGADGAYVRDIGLAAVLRSAVPDLPLFACPQMSVHNLAGVLAAAELGMSRVSLAPELSLVNIQYICEGSPIEIEVFVHGALCFCHSGQCYMSALGDKRSANRGLCTRPCRLEYTMGGRMDDYPLSLKDNCLVHRLDELRDAGVSSLRIEGRTRRPEYTAIVTGIYARALRDQKDPSDEEMALLTDAFSKRGFTDGYLDGNITADMLGADEEAEGAGGRVFAEARRTYSGVETRRVPVKFYAIAQRGEPSRFMIEDEDGNRESIEGPIPHDAPDTKTSAKELEELLYKTGGTPFSCSGVRAAVEEGLFLSPDTINEIRRTLITRLSERRRIPPKRASGYIPPLPVNLGKKESPLKIFQFSSLEQMTEAMAEERPNLIYVPLELLDEDFPRILPFMERGATPVALLPKIITSTENSDVKKMLMKIRAMGVTAALVSNLGHIKLARQSGFDIRAGSGMNAYNSYSLDTLSKAGFLSVTASFELSLRQIRELQKPIDTELIAYGRLPLMITDHCIIKNSAGRCACQHKPVLRGRQGATYPVVAGFGCRNIVLDSKKIFLADKLEDLSEMGLWALRLVFTTESARECLSVSKCYAGDSDYRPNGLTRGAYARGV